MKKQLIVLAALAGIGMGVVCSFAQTSSSGSDRTGTGYTGNPAVGTSSSFNNYNNTGTNPGNWNANSTAYGNSAAGNGNTYGNGM